MPIRIASGWRSSCTRSNCLVHYDASLHYSRKYNARRVFVRARQRVDKGTMLSDRRTDSKALSEVQSWILTRSETPRLRA
jgi:hypothetical protein